MIMEKLTQEMIETEKSSDIKMYLFHLITSLVKTSKLLKIQ